MALSSTRLSSIIPALPEQERPLPEPLRFFNRAYTSMHREHDGFYSLDKLHAFQAAPTGSVARHIACLCVATLPTIVVIAGLELIPLQDPTLPWTQNPGFFVRQFVRAWLIGISGNIQIQELIPQLRQSWPRLLLLALVQILSYIATLICGAQAFGIFPVPLSALIPIIPTTIVSIIIRFVFVRGVLERNPELKPIHERMERLTGFTFSIILLYCGYGFVFRRVGVYAQIVLSIVLYIIKQWAKGRMWKLSHVQDHHDLSAESVSCGVHLFHVLFTIMCLQTAQSIGTFVVVLVLNMAQDILTFRFLRRISTQVDAVLRELNELGLTSTPFLVDWTADLRADSKQPSTANNSDHSPIVRLQSAYFRFRQTSPSIHDISSSTILPAPPLLKRRSSIVDRRQQRSTQAVANLLHCRELVLLRLFIDVIVPLFYLAYCIVMKSAPGGHWRYFENLTELDSETLDLFAIYVALLVLVKVIVFYAVCRLFRSHGQPSGLHQLAFVVWAQRWSMQTWFIMNFLQIIDFPLQHMGNDLSFRFKWLHKTQ